MSFFTSLLLSLLLCVPHTSHAEDIVPQIDIRLRIHHLTGGRIEYELIDENNEGRLLGNYTFNRSTLMRVAQDDLEVREERQRRLWYYSWLALAGFAVSTVATGMEATNHFLVNKELLNPWLLPLESTGAISFGTAYFWILAQVTSEHKAIARSILLEKVFKRQTPRRRSEFIRFVAEFEAALKYIAKSDCKNQLKR